MHIVDLVIFIVYMLVVLGVGFYFLRKNNNMDDYYVGGRKMGSMHVGLSVVATDVGGGFSIGLGGLGFIMGISGSWMLFTGLVGAWLSAVFLIPKVSVMNEKYRFLTFPQIFEVLFTRRVAVLAAIVSAVGYLGFTSSQLLAGAKLASATFPELDLQSALIIMGIIAVVYTVIGGLKAVIYTDTFQWILLMTGLIGIGIPVGYVSVGGYSAIVETLPKEFLKLSNISWQTIINWGVTIIPIWFVGMTLYQRIYATKDKKSAQRAWYFAGFLEWPLMAFMGVILGLFARVAFENGMFAELGYAAGSDIDPEMGLPLFLRTVLPIGLMGLMLSAFFSAVLSTADSCLMAASGNIFTDILDKIYKMPADPGSILRISQMLTLVIGGLALFIAVSMENVLELMLYSYAFMVSGLFVPVIAGFYWKNATAKGAFAAMLGGGLTTLLLIISQANLPLGLDANVYGLTISAILMVVVSITDKKYNVLPKVG
ncbi:MAG: sodium:solute symporter family protein [Saprospirales bacterium]|nr:MAG: sodium:solute symporter family protein [Saprospirales bacterium]